MSCFAGQDPQLVRLVDAIAQRVGPQRFNVWFDRSTKLDLKNDGLEISVPNDFISEWIGTHFTRTITEATAEVLGTALPVRFCVVPQLFDVAGEVDHAPPAGSRGNGHSGGGHNGHGHANGKAAGNARGHGGSVTRTARKPVEVIRPALRAPAAPPREFESEPSANNYSSRARLRHDLDCFVVGQSNQMAVNAARYVSEFPGAQYNPLFIHAGPGLGKTHLLQGLCRRLADLHPTKRWMYMTAEDFTNEFLLAVQTRRGEAFRRKMRDLDLLAIDDVQFFRTTRAAQEEFLHTFNAIEAMGRQVVLASHAHPKSLENFGESLINRFVSGMVVRIDPPNFVMRCELIRQINRRMGNRLTEEVVQWIAKRVTQNVREMEGSVVRISAQAQLAGRQADVAMAQETLAWLDRAVLQPVKPDSILQSVCEYFGLEHRDLMSGRRQRTISLARSVAMFLVRKTARLSFPEIGLRMGKRNHSTVISACRRIERAVMRNEVLAWSSSIGERSEEAQEMIQRLEEQARAISAG